MDWIASRVVLISSDGVIMKVRNESAKRSHCESKKVALASLVLLQDPLSDC
jgi:hypothetical protein